MQSQWHNLPTFDSVLQQDGAAFCARNVQTRFMPDSAQISMELSGAWPKQAHLDSLTRTAALTADGLTLTDIARGSYQTAFLSLMLCEKPQVEADHILLGALGTIRLEGAAGAVETDVLPIQDTRLRTACPWLFAQRYTASSSLSATYKSMSQPVRVAGYTVPAAHSFCRLSYRAHFLEWKAARSQRLLAKK